MKKKWITFLFILLCPGLALADWKEDFIKDYDGLGLDDAVEKALDQEVSPHEILTLLISSQKKFETLMSLQALYCAGADRDAVREAADKLSITVEEVSVALEESIAECGSKVALSDRDLMDEPASSPESGASNSNQLDPQFFVELIDNPASPDTTTSPGTTASPGRPSSPSNP